MYKIFLALSFVLFFSADISARGIVPFCSACEYIEVVEDLPDTEMYQLESGEFLDLGFKYKQFWLVWVPFWNYEGEYCLVNPADDETFYEITPEELESIAAENSITLSENPISFWNKIGGKIVGALLLGLVIWGYIGKSDDEEEIVESVETT